MSVQPVLPAAFVSSASSHIPSSSIIDSWFSSDLSQFDSPHWRPHSHDQNYGDEVYSESKAGDAVWWIKVTGLLSGSLFEVDDLLDRSLVQRQSEWHALFIGGFSIIKHSPTVEICYFQYKSGSFLVSPRDCCYIKARKNLFHSDGSARGVLLSYRSIPLNPPNELSPDKSSKFERTTFSGAHLLEFTEKHGEFRYSYIQHADPGGWIPNSLANRPQCSIMAKEIQGVRKVVTEAKKVRSHPELNEVMKEVWDHWKDRQEEEHKN
jgi:hypothetical protein